MVNPQSVVDCKDKILSLFAEKEDIEKILKNIDSHTHDALNSQKELLDTQIKSLTSENTSNLDNAFKVENDKYLSQVENLKTAKQKSLDKMNEKISSSRENYLRDNTAPLQPLWDFASYKNEIEPIIRSVPLHVLYEEVEPPVLNDVNDVLNFNKSLMEITQLEHLKDVQLNRFQDKITLLVKPIELLVGRLGEEKRMIVEIAYFLLMMAMLSQFKVTLLPIVTLGCTTIIYMRYRNTKLLRKYCSTFFQASNYLDKIESKIKDIALKEYEPKLESFKAKNSKKISVTYEKELAKLVKPDRKTFSGQLDFSQLEKHHAEQLDSIKREAEHRKQESQYKLENISTVLNAELGKLQGMNEECKSILDTFDKNGILPPFVHLGEIVNTRYNINYPYMYPTIKESLCVTYDNYSRESAVNFVKYYITQLWRYVEAGYVKFHVIDTKDFGKDMNDLTVKNEKLIEVHTDNSKVGDLYVEATNELKRRSTDILRKYESIEQYNKMMFEQDASLCPYTIYLNLNPTLEHLLHTSHMALIDQASSRGILIVNIIGEDFFTTLRDQEQVNFLNMYENHEYKISFQNNSITQGLILSEDELFTSIRVDKTKYVEVADKMRAELENGGLKALMYHDHRERNFPNTWSEVPIKDIELSPGNLNGEKDKPVTILLGDSNPHGLIAGVTGSGKSVALNSIIMCAAHKYSPDWLQMVGLDFKGVELLVYGKPYALPHMRVVSATRDVDYVLSIFDDLVGEMEARNKLFEGVLGVKNYVEFAKAMLNPEKKVEFWKKVNDPTNKNMKTLRETPEGKRLFDSMTANGKYLVIPRIMFIIDEFADMFLINDDLKDKVTRAIKTLSKKARSSGIHMLFASQNMEGTVPEEVLEQFPLRICLPCSLNVSNALIGNPEAGKLPRTYAISNDKVAEKEKYNQYFKVAYEDTEPLKAMIKELNEAGKALGYTKIVPIYDEAVKHEYYEFRENLFKYTKLHKTNTYMLGEPRIYQRMNIPVTMSLAFKERNNLAILAKNKDLMNGMSVVFLDNYAKKNINTIFQTADDEFLPKYDISYNIENLPYCTYDSDCSAIEEFLEATLASRKTQRNNGTELKPLYVILHSVNSMMSFGVESVRADAQDFMANNMLELNKHMVFFIVMSTSARSIRQLYPHFMHIVVGDLDERDIGYVPDSVSKAMRGISENQAFYVNTDTNASKSFKPYEVFKTEKVDETKLFM